jgi:sulfate permease, SulP family
VTKAGSRLPFLEWLPNYRVVVYDLGGVFDVEYSALKMLVEAQKRQREAGVAMWLADLTPAVYATVQVSRAAR